MSVAARRRTYSGLVVAMMLALSGGAGAQTDIVAAEALFREGRRLMGDKQYNEACPKLAESFRLDPATGALLALAICHEAQGKTASAWGEYNDAAARSRRENRQDREKTARERVTALEPKLSKLVIDVAPGVETIAALEVKRDGVLLGSAAWGTPIPIDPGEHIIEASAPGRTVWRGNIVVSSEPGEQSVIVPMLAEVPKPAAAGAGKDPGAEQGAKRALAAGPGKDALAVAPGVAEARQAQLRTAALVAGGLGVLSIGIGTGFGIRAINKKNESSSLGCVDNACPPDAKPLRQDALSAGRISTVGFTAGGVLLAGGVVLYMLAPKLAGRGETEVQVSLVGTSTTGLVVAGRF